MTNIVNRRTIVMATACLPFYACSGIGTDTAEWEEEIKLHDGQFIQLQRKAACKSSGFPNSNRGPNIYFSLEYTALQAFWKGQWNRWPVSFELFEGIPHLAAFIMDRESCAGKAPTEYAAEFYKFKNGQWKILSQSEYPTSQALMNLYINFWGRSHQEDPNGLVRWQSPHQGDDFNPDHPMTIDSYFKKYQNLLCKYI